MNQHPNAIAAFLTTQVATLVLIVANKLGVEMDGTNAAVVASELVGLGAALVLFIGRRLPGIKSKK